LNALRNVTIGCLAVGASLLVGVVKADPKPAPVVEPRVTRPAGEGAPVFWPVCGAEDGGADLRMCGWWHDGWDVFAERMGLPAVRRFGRVWVHNPGGFIPREVMKFQQFSEATAQAKLAGSGPLTRIADWPEFTRQMNRIGREGDLAVYVGNPATMELRPGETDDQWLGRAWDELAAVHAIEKKPLLGFDATVGTPADSTPYGGRYGGPRGLVARFFRRLHEAGYEFVVEPGVLAQATWLDEIAGTVGTEMWWDTTLGGKDVAAYSGNAAQGYFFKPSQLRHRQVRYLIDVWRKPKEDQQPLIDASLAAGYDVAIGIMTCPGYPSFADEIKSEEEAAPAAGP
jgi:hypothetical protein